MLIIDGDDNDGFFLHQSGEHRLSVRIHSLWQITEHLAYKVVVMWIWDYPVASK
jgi:hypothetical protein